MIAPRLLVVLFVTNAIVFAGEPVASSAGTIAPVAVTASGSQASSPNSLIDGSGLAEDPARSGVFVHDINRWADGGSMWTSNGEALGPQGACWLRFDLGRSYAVTGLHVWNYNEGGGWQARSCKRFELLVSQDDKSWTPAGGYDLRQASGRADEAGEMVTLTKPVQARYLKLVLTSHYGRDNLVGLSEVRVRVDQPAADARVLRTKPPFKSRYARTTYAPRALGVRIASGEDIRFPADAGVVDVTHAPYHAKGDGTTDDTAAINRAFMDHVGQGAFIYLPNGIYRITDTIRWGHRLQANGEVDGGSQEKNTVLQGQSRSGVILRLDDHATGFDDVHHPKPVVWTGGDPAQRFFNEIANLTIDTGAMNPGCSGVAFVANNQGSIHDVTIASGDGQGFSGLNLAAAGENGPLLVRRVRVVGFDIGVTAGSAINSQTIEGLDLADQNQFGVRSFGQHLTMRTITSRNEVPAISLKGGLTVIIDAKLTGTASARTTPAIMGEGGIYARDVTTSGYARAFASQEGAKVGEWSSRPPVCLLAAPPTALNLPIKESPDTPWDGPASWSSPLAFGGKPDDDIDDTESIQRAIDSGASTVYLPRGNWRIDGTVIVRGKVTRFTGCRASLSTKRQDGPLIRIADGSVAGDGTVICDHLTGPWHGVLVFAADTKRTVAIRHCGNTSASFAGGGDVFLDDVVNNPGRGFTFTGGKVWARQFNCESRGLHTSNDGARLWILGYKTELGGTLLATSNGGATELLGGFSYTTGDGALAPMFTVKDGRLSAAFGEVCFSNDPFRVIAEATHADKTVKLEADDPRYGRCLTTLRVGGP